MKSDWIWMPHPGHFICSYACRFVLNTYVNGYIVSTVGEYFPDSRVREIMANCRNVKIEGQGDTWDANYLKKIGYEEIGANRKYESMVFKAAKAKDKCCPYRAVVSADVTAESDNVWS